MIPPSYVETLPRLPFGRLTYWIGERWSLQQRRLRGETPWTSDPLLGGYRFCCVDREDDAVTRWIAAYVRPRLPVGPDLVAALLACRVHNDPPVLGATLLESGALEGGRFNAARFGRAMERWVALGRGRAFRGAYMMPTHATVGETAHGYYGRTIRKALSAGRAYWGTEAPTSLAEAAGFLEGLTGVGPFLTNQVVTDLRYCGPSPRSHYPDWTLFLIPGPGTLRGLALLGYPATRATWSRVGAYGRTFRDLQRRVREAGDRTGVPDHVWSDPNNLANCLCEFSKFERAVERIAAGKRPSLRPYRRP